MCSLRGIGSVKHFICCGPADRDALLVHHTDRIPVGFQGHFHCFLPWGAALSSLTCQNDRVPTSNTARQPLHNIHSGSKHVCGSSMSLPSSWRSAGASHVSRWLFGDASPLLQKGLTPQISSILQGFAADTNIRFVLSVVLFVLRKWRLKKEKS